MTIRTSLPSELQAIRELHLDAFDKTENIDVSELAVALAQNSKLNLSLVAVDNGAIIGHIVFSPVSLNEHPTVAAHILSPLAVAPTHQCQGVGRQLIESGLKQLAAQRDDLVFVLGDPAYYSHYGFHRNHHIEPPYPLPYPEAWQIIELKAGIAKSLSGTITCVPALMPPELW